MDKPKFIQWMGDNQFDVEEFCGQELTEDEDCPDILIIPTASGTTPADLGNYIIKHENGTLEVIMESGFREKYN
jgi:hypothetical protein